MDNTGTYCIVSGLLSHSTVNSGNFDREGNFDKKQLDLQEHIYLLEITDLFEYSHSP